MKRRLGERLMAGIFLAIPAGVAFLLWALGFYLLGA